MTPLYDEQPAETQGLHNGDLPEGWVSAKLPEIVKINMGQSPPGRSYNNRGDGLPFFQGKADFGNRYPTVRVWCSQPKKIAQPGDVLISVRAPVGPTNVADHVCAIGRGLAAITPLGGIPSEFILFRLRLLEPGLALSGTGSTFTAISRKDLEEIDIDVPPMAEQKCIVAKVEELLTRVNATKERLAKVAMILKRFRQAVLAAACSGRLTADWRENQSHIQHAKDLLSSILAERREFLEESHLRKRKTSNFRYPYEEPMRTDPSEFGEIPDGWIWALGADLFTWSSGDFLPKKKQEKGPYPIYGGNGIIGFHSGYLIDHPTLVIGRVGALCGNVYITSGKAWVTDNAIYAAHVPKYLNLQYIQMVFSQSNLNTNAGGSGQPFVNQTALNKVVVPLPPLAEQHEIVRRVDAMFKLADAVEKRVAVATARAEKLNQAILAKAFRGELVPTEAELAHREGRSYETASELLARIKSQTDAKQASQKVRRNRN